MGNFICNQYGERFAILNTENVKLCSNKILLFLTGGVGYTGHKTVVCVFMCVNTQRNCKFRMNMLITDWLECWHTTSNVVEYYTVFQNKNSHLLTICNFVES